MSIVRIGLAETKKFAEGYDAIFGKKQADEPRAEEEKTEEAKAKKVAKPAKKKGKKK